MKVQFGCGGNFLPGWENHDIEIDISKPSLPYESNSVEMILAEHVFEHITQREGIYFLIECYRILKDGGVLRLCVPVITNVDEAKALDLILNHGHKAYYNASLLQEAMIVSGFHPFKIIATPRKEIDGHWRVIGEEQDALETVRLEATK